MENELNGSICDQKLLIEGAFWCSKYARFYIGSCDQISLAASTTPAVSKAIAASVSCCDYLYFVCWGKHGNPNGFLAKINSTFTNDKQWEVFATGIGYTNAAGPSTEEVLAQIEKATCHHYWKGVVRGPKNIAGNPISGNTVNAISPNADFIWHDSGMDASSGPLLPPFKAFNHDEFLIFRLAVKKVYPACADCECEDCDCCDCGCSGCHEKAGKQETVLAQRAKGKQFLQHGSANATICAPPYRAVSCTPALAAKKLNLCFHLHWGDGPNDQFESSDTEVLYLTVCNPYADLKFKGVRVTKLTVLPAQPLTQLQLVPGGFIHFDCIEPCSCKSRELVLLTKNVPPGNYTLEVEYCVDGIEVTSYVGGKTTFPIKIVQD